MIEGPRFRVVNLTRGVEIANAVELAGDGAARRKGLLGRSGLNEGQGLWIAPCEAVHTFGMQFPIDVLYLNRKQRVAKVVQRLPPWRFSACLLARSVVELRAGTLARTGTCAGDEIRLEPVS